MDLTRENEERNEPNESIYSGGKIFKVVSEKTNKIYIGSTTCHSLNDVLCRYHIQHKLFKQGTLKSNLAVFDILKNEDAKIMLLEKYPCKSRTELATRETHFLESNLELCVNKKKPIHNQEFYKKRYYKLNKDRIRIKQRKLHQEMKDNGERCEACDKTISNWSMHVLSERHKKNQANLTIQHKIDEEKEETMSDDIKMH